MSVSVAENKIVCYNVDNAITNAELMGPGPRWKKGPSPTPASDAYGFPAASA